MMLRIAGSLVAVVVLALVLPASVAGQVSSAGAIAGNLPRTPDGQPDLQGVWQAGGGTTTYSIEKGDDDRRVHLSITGQVTDAHGLIVDPPDGRIPYQPWAEARSNDIHSKHADPPTLEYIDPVERGCFPSGVPRINYQGGNSIRIIQRPEFVAMIHESYHLYRVIPLDNRPRLPEDLKLWMGDSRGHFEGNTLVVEGRNFNDKTWFDIVGGIHTDALRVVERWTLTAEKTLTYEATLEDPKAFARPFTIRTRPFKLVPAGYEQWEDACVEGNRTMELIMNLVR